MFTIAKFLSLAIVFQSASARVFTINNGIIKDIKAKDLQLENLEKLSLDELSPSDLTMINPELFWSMSASQLASIRKLQNDFIRLKNNDDFIKTLAIPESVTSFENDKHNSNVLKRSVNTLRGISEKRQ